MPKFRFMKQLKYRGFQPAEVVADGRTQAVSGTQSIMSGSLSYDVYRVKSGNSDTHLQTV